MTTVLAIRFSLRRVNFCRQVTLLPTAFACPASPSLHLVGCYTPFYRSQSAPLRELRADNLAREEYHPRPLVPDEKQKRAVYPHHLRHPSEGQGDELDGGGSRRLSPLLVQLQHGFVLHAVDVELGVSADVAELSRDLRERSSDAQLGQGANKVGIRLHLEARQPEDSFLPGVALLSKHAHPPIPLSRVLGQPGNDHVQLACVSEGLLLILCQVW
mmetsp:Transcript_6768/g.18956  ORF Transcript_6768/g.18956 Transcript_6768/m.18956 type:complete len:215 (+) Transcript_6768:118-762(+)